LPPDYKIIEFEERYRDDVIHLWNICDLTRPWNDPNKDIDRILSDQTGKLFIVRKHNKVLGSVMVGYDGHRGSVYYLSVHPDYQKKSLGRLLMNRSEEYLLTLGCSKLNLMVRTSNIPVIEFYGRLGYEKDEVVVLGKRLITDQKQH
jgi:ribosomal protein S18 acetylase RimI-like enzyme